MKMYFARTLLITLFTLLLISACGKDEPAKQPPAGMADKPAMPESEPMKEASALADSWWPQHGLEASEQRYSPLTQINTDTVKDLGLAWTYEPPVPNDGFAGTPIVVDGVVYMTGTGAVVFALDAITGEELWFYDPETNFGHGFSVSWAGRRNHGVAVEDGKVFVATPDCRLIALNSENGEVIWEVQACDSDAEYSMAGAPRVAKGKVYIGNGICDYGARGFVTAYDANTGEQVWRFFNVPGDPSKPYENPHLEMVAKTWSTGWAEGGGACAWDSIVFDEEFNNIYFGTDSGLPWDPSVRSPGGGDNLFLNSIVAVDADSGEYRWHYQTVPSDAWDLNAASQIILADLEIEGEKRKVLMQAPKNGFFYVIDRSNGKVISANNYVPVTWATHVDLESGRPVETPNARYFLNEDKKSNIEPMVLGAHNWHAMSYNHLTGLVYIPAQNFATTYDSGMGSPLGGISFGYYEDKNMNEDATGLSEEGKKKVRGQIIAWDPITQTEKWSLTHEAGMNGSLFSSAGNLVFQGAADGVFRAHAADTGEVLWKFDTGSTLQGGPVSYSVNGEQYILLPAGSVSMVRYMVPLYGDLPGPTQMLAFKLNGDAALPEYTPYEPEVPLPPEQTASAEQIERGGELFDAVACGLCHGYAGVGVRPGGSVPSLQYLAPETHAQFKDIVLKGIRKPMGMQPHEGIITEQDAEDIHAFVIHRQWQLYNAKQKEKQQN